MDRKAAGIAATTIVIVVSAGWPDRDITVGHPDLGSHWPPASISSYPPHFSNGSNTNIAHVLNGGREPRYDST
jgi:hypothetical protein